jgi:hypothetical protein
MVYSLPCSASKPAERSGKLTPEILPPFVQVAVHRQRLLRSTLRRWAQPCHSIGCLSSCGVCPLAFGGYATCTCKSRADCGSTLRGTALASGSTTDIFIQCAGGCDLCATKGALSVWYCALRQHPSLLEGLVEHVFLYALAAGLLSHCLALLLSQVLRCFTVSGQRHLH